MATAAEIAREKKRRSLLARKPWNPVEALDPQQLPMFFDRTRNRVFTGTRQLGKTRFALTDSIHAGIETPNSESAYVDMDKEHGGKVAWEELRRMMDEWRIPAKIVDDELKFDNGSRLWIFSGEDAELKKLQGFKFARLIIDEAQEMRNINKLLALIGPALLKHNGRVILMGIPGRVRGLGDWWDISEGKDAHLFGQHRGSLWDNPHLSNEAKIELFETEKQRMGEHSPDFIRHWLGKWPETNLILRMYHYDSDRDGYDGEPPQFPRYAMGLDPGGVRDSEAIVVIGHGNDDRVNYQVDEDVTDRLEGGGWDDSGDRVGPMQEKWNCHIRYYDWGSAHKDALTLIYRKDQQILLTGVPSKDPYEESKRINKQFAQEKLKVKRGSKLEKDLLYTEWDEDSLKNGGKPKQSSIWKQDAADGLRCAMWAIWGFTPKERASKLPLSDVEREIERIRKGEAYKNKATMQRQDKYHPTNLAAPAFPSRNPSPRLPRNGRINRGY